MYVCLCHAFTDRQLRDAARNGGGSVEGIYRSLGVAPRCGKCLPVVEEILRGRAEESAAVTA